MLKKILLSLSVLVTMIPITRAQDINLTSELDQMISTDHFWQKQDYKTYQFSGFNRDGNNPDDVHALYKEDKWHVYTDCKGPGVATRIWSTYRLNRGWGNVKVEVDGKVIYEGPTADFFNGKTPFAPPLSQVVVRSEEEGKKFGISYVPIPFEKRFRFMLDVPNYNIVNVKLFNDKATKITGFSGKINKQELKSWHKVAEVFKMEHPYITKKNVKTLKKTLTFNKKGSQDIKLNGSAVIRGIEIDADSATLSNLHLEIFWDHESMPSVSIPVELGFGSNNQQTLLLGRNEQSKYIYIPMPFKESAQLVFNYHTDNNQQIPVTIFTEDMSFDKQPISYLHGYYNSGSYFLKSSTPKFPTAPLNEYFYKNGFSVLDIKGEGHIIAYMDYFKCQPELDEHIFVDECNNFPNNIWNGTGHEDLFDMSWGHFNRSSAYVSGGSEFGEEVNTRIFWNSTLTFNHGIKWIWEWTPNIYKNPNRDASFSSVVFYYLNNRDK
ncbi:DUF2961 domain-containing protein [Puteibacter caeruleilacunae]|nr:DUF2961 domain-containing protein [Puteibacter caeruleilacunae]